MSRRSAARVALATCAALPELDPDDRPLPAALDSHGVRAEPAVWSESRDWAVFDAVVLRSCWDYDTKQTAFRRWLAALDAKEIPVMNSTAIVRGNLHKGYLRDLRAVGVCVPVTRFLRRGEPFDIATILHEQEWQRAVVKPAVSMSGRDTWLITTPIDEPQRRAVEALAAREDVMVQEFVPEVLEDGEWSFVFFGDTFSHAVRKRPAAGEFRVQNELGGSIEPIVPEPVHRRAAESVLRTATGEPTVYARVDAAVRGEELMVLEVELIDPVCYCTSVAGATERFAGEIVRVLQDGSSGKE